jgi:hypothetical protein
MASKVTRYLILSQLSLYVFLGICIVIMPAFVFNHNEGGASNYGVHFSTVAPYTLGFLLSTICIIQSGRLIPGGAKTASRFRQALYVLAGLQLVVLASTYSYKSSLAVDHLHVMSVILTFLFDMVFAGWMIATVLKDKTAVWLFAIEFAGFLLGVGSFIGAIHLLFLAQVVTGLAFGGLLIRSGQKLVL